MQNKSPTFAFYFGSVKFLLPQKAMSQLTQSFTFWIFKAFIMEWWVQKNRNPNWIHYFRVVLGAWFEKERVCVSKPISFDATNPLALSSLLVTKIHRIA